MDYSIHRYYSSQQGRFTSVDPGNVGADEGDPQSWNGYSYALNNPLLYGDPDGLSVRVCDKDGACTEVSDETANKYLFNKAYQRAEGLTVKSGKIYQGGERIGSYQNLSIDGAPYSGAAFEVGRRAPAIRSTIFQLWGQSVAMGLGISGAPNLLARAAGESLLLLQQNSSAGPLVAGTVTKRDALSAIKSGANEVEVRTRGEAEAIRRHLVEGQGYRNSTGFTGRQVRNNPELFPTQKYGTYHWDYADTQHGGVPHVQVHTHEGRVIRIFFKQGAGLPIRTPPR